MQDVGAPGEVGLGTAADQDGGAFVALRIVRQRARLVEGDEQVIDRFDGTDRS